MSNPIADAILDDATDCRLKIAELREQRRALVRHYCEETELLQRKINDFDTTIFMLQESERAAYEAAASADASDGMARSAA